MDREARCRPHHQFSGITSLQRIEHDAPIPIRTRNGGLALPCEANRHLHACLAPTPHWHRPVALENHVIGKHSRQFQFTGAKGAERGRQQNGERYEPAFHGLSLSLLLSGVRSRLATRPSPR
jgi:hypothetical protein